MRASRRAGARYPWGAMASSLFMLLDDIATVLDDVSIAAKKTAGVLGDDLALNAQQVTGISAERELPVVWRVARGSLLNKAILVPAALLISQLAPWAIVPLLMLGGLFLCFEGVEKLAHKFFHDPEEEAHDQALHAAATDASVDLVALERDKIKGAIRTDFILSAEIIVISLGVVATRPLGTQAAVLAGIAVVMTIGVYGLVAGIVKLDDLGIHLMRRPGSAGLGRVILAFAPRFMKFLSFAGTVAMFLVGGGILVHGIPALHHLIVEHTAGAGAVVKAIGPTVAELVVGVLAGIAALVLFKLVTWPLRKRKA